MIRTPSCVWAMLLLASTAVGQEPPAAGGSKWLEASPVVGWNQQGAAVPKPPSRDGESLKAGRCADQARPPEGPADAAITAAGWTLVGPLQVFGDTAVALGAVSADGMCRPLGLQGFVFVGSRFVGTLSPAPMDARTDGALQSVLATSRDRVTATFAGYKPDDPLCCPSRVLRVSYLIKRSPGGSVLVVEHVTPEGAPAP